MIRNEHIRLINELKREREFRLLLEKQGILEFGSEDYDSLLNRIIEDISQSKGVGNVPVKYNDVLFGTYNWIKCPTELTWLKNLNVLYMTSAKEPEYFSIVKEGFSINDEINAFNIKNNKYAEGTIILRISDFNHNELYSVLRHELKHLFYFLKNKILLEDANKDILFFETYEYKNKIFFADYITDYKNFAPLGFVQIIKNIDDFVVQSLYNLNLNECRSHLENVYSELKENIQRRDLYRDSFKHADKNGLDFNSVYLKRLSPIYELYHILHDIYKAIYSYSTKNPEFSENVTVIPELNEFYGTKNFEDFCLFACQRIKKEILSKTKKLYTSLIN